MREKLSLLLPRDTLARWDQWTEKIDSLYDVDRLWNKGFGNWIVEYKYRRGGKTLCTFYAKEGAASLLITLGKAERDKFEAERDSFSAPLSELYDATETLHDGKWLWIPVQSDLPVEDILSLLRIKRRPNRK